MTAKRIGILTGGGDVPGLNSVIKSVVYRGAEIGCEVIGIRRGWEGLTHIDLNDNTLEGLRHRNLPLFSVQYHPEASPGPHDSHYLFTQFTDMMTEFAQPGSSRG